MPCNEREPDAVIAHVAGAPIEELLLPLASSAGAMMLAVRSYLGHRAAARRRGSTARDRAAR